MSGGAGASHGPYRGVLVTGGAGYLGSGILRRLAPLLGAPETHVRVFGRTPPADSAAAAPFEIERVTGDIRDHGIWTSLLKDVDLVFHLAAQTSVYRAEEDPVADQEINVTATLRMLEACRESKVKPVVVFAGTATQVGVTGPHPVDESLPDDPVTLYDLHKLMAERYLRYYVRAGYIRGASLRLANVYGPGPISGSADRGVLNSFIRKGLAGERLTIYGTGSPVRDYIFVDDAAEAFGAAASHIDGIDGGYFVIGSGQGCSIAEAVALVAERVLVRTGRLVDVVHVDPPGPMSRIEMRNFVADSGRFCSATGWHAAVPLKEGIDRTIDAHLVAGGGR